jgi:hypothetical protein
MLGAQLVEALIPLPSSALQLLSPVDKARGRTSQGKHKRGGGEGRETPKYNRKNAYLKDPPRGTRVDPQRLVQRVVERGAVVAELLPQRLLGLRLAEVGWRYTGVLPLLLRTRHDAIWSGEGGAQ